MKPNQLHKLRDYPGVAEFETRCLMNANLMAPAASRDPDTGIDELMINLFGITTTTLADIDFPDLSEDEDLLWQLECDRPGTVAMFAARGWDVTDEYGHELRGIEHYKAPLAAALMGIPPAKLPSRALSTSDWEKTIAKDAANFRRKR